MSSATAPAGRSAGSTASRSSTGTSPAISGISRFAEATYHLHLAGSARPLRWTAFTGRRGARGTDWHGDIGADGTLTVSTTRTLAPGEGLTVVAELPASAVEPPSASTLLWYQLLDNRHWIFGGVGFLVVLIYYFAAWEAVGRDPKARHHHSAVPSAAGHFAGARQLHP